MPSFQIAISPGQRAAARFIGNVRRTIQQALIETGITQSELSRDIGVHRSVISREIRGQSDLSLGRVGEIAYYMGKRPKLVFEDVSAAHGTNITATDAGRTIDLQRPPVDTNGFRVTVKAA